MVKDAYYCTIEKSERLLGYQTKHSLTPGLESMIKWAIDFGPQQPTYALPLEITKGAPRVWLDKEMSNEGLALGYLNGEVSIHSSLFS